MAGYTRAQAGVRGHSGAVFRPRARDRARGPQVRLKIPPLAATRGLPVASAACAGRPLMAGPATGNNGLAKETS